MENSNGYVPHPLDVSDVILGQKSRELVQYLAQNIHEDWLSKRMEEAEKEAVMNGRPLKEVMCEFRERYPQLHPWPDLSDKEREASVVQADKTLKLYALLVGGAEVLEASLTGGVSIMWSDDLVEQLAGNAHDVWAKEKMDNGWTYGPERDNEAKHHPMLVPFGMVPEAEKACDLGVVKVLKGSVYEFKAYLSEMEKYSVHTGDGAQLIKLDYPELRTLYEMEHFGIKLDDKYHFSFRDKKTEVEKLADIVAFEIHLGGDRIDSEDVRLVLDGCTAEQLEAFRNDVKERAKKYAPPVDACSVSEADAFVEKCLDYWLGGVQVKNEPSSSVESIASLLVTRECDRRSCEAHREEVSVGRSIK